jgi:hypothetical protein
MSSLLFRKNMKRKSHGEWPRTGSLAHSPRPVEWTFTACQHLRQGTGGTFQHEAENQERHNGPFACSSEIFGADERAVFRFFVHGLRYCNRRIDVGQRKAAITLGTSHEDPLASSCGDFQRHSMAEGPVGDVTNATRSSTGGPRPSRARPRADHEVVVAVFGDLPPEIFLVAKSLH